MRNIDKRNFWNFDFSLTLCSVIEAGFIKAHSCGEITYPWILQISHRNSGLFHSDVDLGFNFFLHHLQKINRYGKDLKPLCPFSLLFLSLFFFFSFCVRKRFRRFSMYFFEVPIYHFILSFFRNSLWEDIGYFEYALITYIHFHISSFGNFFVFFQKFPQEIFHIKKKNPPKVTLPPPLFFS